MDLDWPGCGQKADWPFAMWCADTEGCAAQLLWLDTPRQQCRFTDEYKLMPENVPRFLPVELARLEEKSATFASKGCLFGGWWGKCYRRMRQIVRLLKYVRRAVQDAKTDGSHPAHALATSSETQQTLEHVANNMVEGFGKHEANHARGVDFGAAYDSLRALPAMLRATKEAAEAGEGGQAVSSAEKGAMESTAAIEAMLKATRTELSEEQRSELFAEIEAGGATGVDEDEVDRDVEIMAAELDAAFQGADESDLASLSAQGEVMDETVDPEDAKAEAEDKDPSALLELGEGAGANASRAMRARGTGPLKWIFKHGLGWLVTRVAWLVLFLVGAALGLVRAVAFPILFLGCVLAKFMVWVFRDFGYNLLWEGETSLVVGRFKKMGKCAPWMWEAIGFDASADDVAAQVVIQPLQFASDTTGVHHFYKSSKDLCKHVECGENAKCHGGKCVCTAGTYPAEGANCAGALTRSGCRCKVSWEETNHLFWTKTRYGCPVTGACKVNKYDPTYKTCQHKLESEAPSLLRKLGIVPDQGKRDACVQQPFRTSVPRLGS